eukprot:28264-Prorocentrum_minimum.AAC.1
MRGAAERYYCVTILTRWAAKRYYCVTVLTRAAEHTTAIVGSRTLDEGSLAEWPNKGLTAVWSPTQDPELAQSVRASATQAAKSFVDFASAWDQGEDLLAAMKGPTAADFVWALGLVK